VGFAIVSPTAANASSGSHENCRTSATSCSHGSMRMTDMCSQPDSIVPIINTLDVAYTYNVMDGKDGLTGEICCGIVLPAASICTGTCALLACIQVLSMLSWVSNGAIVACASCHTVWWAKEHFVHALSCILPSCQDLSHMNLVHFCAALRSLW
jgi:hypothetical protein